MKDTPTTHRLVAAVIVIPALMLWLTSPVGAQPVVELETYFLQPDTAGQTITLHVTGDTAVQGLNFNATIADGGQEFPGGSIDGPTFQSVDLIAGTIFAGNNAGQTDNASIPQFISASVTTQSGTVVSDGLLATLTIDTTGFFSGSFDLTLSEPGGTGEINFAGIPIETRGNGQLVIPEPASVAMMGTILASLIALPHRRRKEA